MRHILRNADFTRRSFFRAASSAGIFGLASAGCFLPKQKGIEPVNFYNRVKAVYGPDGTTTLVGPDPLPPTGVYPEMPPAKVGLSQVKRVSGEYLDYKDIERAVRESVEAAGGIDEIKPGQRVLIKPNMCGPSDGGLDIGRITTKPDVVRAIVRMVKERGATALVGDRSAYQTEKAFVKCGFAKICQEEGAIAFPFTRSKYELFKPGQRHWSEGFHMPGILSEVDHWINAPMLKNHDVTAAEYTCCLKAFVGICMPIDRLQEGKNAMHQNNIGEKIAELNLCSRPLINVVDATTIITRCGPDAGALASGMGLFPKRDGVVWAKPRLILAGKDRVATDSVALSALKLYASDDKVDRPYVDKSVWSQPQIYYAAELGIGQAVSSRISIEEANVARIDEILDNWA